MGCVNEDELAWTEIERGSTRFRTKKLGMAAGGDRLGCRLHELPPGGRSWPYHYHTGNEEAIYVLAGKGRVRIGEESQSLAAGDYVAFPAGAHHAHRVVNDSEATLRYLAVSTMEHPDVVVYPELQKVGVFAGSAPGSVGPRTVHCYFRESDSVDIWEEESG